MGPETSVLTRFSAPFPDIGGQKEAYPNSWYDANLQANDDNLRFAGRPFWSRTGLDSSWPGTLRSRQTLMPTIGTEGASGEQA